MFHVFSKAQRIIRDPRGAVCHWHSTKEGTSWKLTCSYLFLSFAAKASNLDLSLQASQSLPSFFAMSPTLQSGWSLRILGRSSAQNMKKADLKSKTCYMIKMYNIFKITDYISIEIEHTSTFTSSSVPNLFTNYWIFSSVMVSIYS